MVFNLVLIGTCITEFYNFYPFLFNKTFANDPNLMQLVLGCMALRLMVYVGFLLYRYVSMPDSN